MTYPAITLETYPPMMLNGTENPFYDEELLEFTVPYSWLSVEFQQDNFGTFDLDFWLMNEYTWDDTLFLYERATTDNVIISEKIVERRI